MWYNSNLHVNNNCFTTNGFIAKFSEHNTIRICNNGTPHTTVQYIHHYYLPVAQGITD